VAEEACARAQAGSGAASLTVDSDADCALPWLVGGQFMSSKLLAALGLLLPLAAVPATAATVYSSDDYGPQSNRPGGRDRDFSRGRVQ
jgi:hypothetical protein